MSENSVQLTSVSYINLNFDSEPENLSLPPITRNSSGLLLQNYLKGDSRGASAEDILDTQNVSNNFHGQFLNNENAEQKPVAIRIQNVVKYYQPGVPILDHLNMTVHEGTIYTLLGSSGCGKTTLLSCTAGLQNVDSGDIRVFGCEPGAKESGVPGKLIGYMPQEISLYPSLSIRELLDYYGILYGMSADEIEERTNFFIKFLDLPPSSRWVGTLSGGQKRRVSFAVSLLPDPPLLILDEPTVGVDPLLRESIWEHLVDLVSRKKTTVIITTHYIEEARNSDVIGLMRNGRLLVEKSPQSLLEEHNTNLLSPIVLKLCQDDAKSCLNVQTLATNNNKSTLNSIPNKLNALNKDGFNNAGKDIHCVQRYTRNISKSKQTKNHLLALIKKNTKLITRSYVFLAFLICVPAIQAFLFCLAVGHDPKPLPFGVVNEEVNFTYPCLPTGENEEDCWIENLSCQYINEIPVDRITLNFYSSAKEAKESLLMGRIWGYMLFPKNYTENFFSRATTGSQFFDNETLAGSNIDFEMDATSKQITAALTKVFGDTFKTFSQKLLRGCGYDERLAEAPLRYLPPVYGDYYTGFVDYLAPSLILGMIFFTPMTSSSMQCIREKKLGTLERTVVTGVQTWEMLVAYSVTESVIVLVQSATGYLILVVVFQIPVKGSVALVIALCVLIGLSGVSVGFLIGSFCKEETEAALLSMAVFFPNFTLAGLFWPIEGLPLVLQYIVSVLPCTLASDSVRSIVNRGWGFFHPKVWPGFAVTLAWIAAYWALNILLHKIKSRRKRF
ncbi:unnamed protein product [Orchesella dallaii]|uniref:ABC transporter G family member 23 n=1 Tax=Orchesella dallaii TaxID=48710 RepID=A0ABP1RWY3_9HEXA